MNQKKVKVIGAGLAGSEAAYQLLKAGFEVDLYEMRPTKMTPAHQTSNFAELVCSNSLRSDVVTNAVGLLKEEMRRLDSLIIRAADTHRVPAGSALAVDRTHFSEYVHAELSKFEHLNIINEEVQQLDQEPTILATGPLTSEAMSAALQELTQDEFLSFYDAIAPVISIEGIDQDIVYRKSRYDKGTADYLNAPMNQQQFDRFYDYLVQAPIVEARAFEEVKVFEGCMPIESMAKRGKKTLLFGPLKPVGLDHNGQRHTAVVQLRQDNAAGNLYNLVGFQTRLTWGAQKELLKLIPGLERAEIVRYGVMHRNTYITAPKLLNAHFQMKDHPHLYIAGQLSGVEGYVESAASGLLASLALISNLKGEAFHFPTSTMIASLGHYVHAANPANFQPMNANFGILNTTVKDKNQRVQQALEAVDAYVST